MSENNKNNELVVVNPEVITINTPFEEKAQALLDNQHYQELMDYIGKKKPEIALVTAQKFFELFLGGEAVEEIHRLNPTFPMAAINWLRIKYDWDETKSKHMVALQRQVADKVLKAQLEATSLYSDLISATVRRYGDKIKKYLQTGDEKELGDSIAIDSLFQFTKTVEALQKVTGQDRNIKINKQETLDVNLSVKTEGPALSPEASAKILSIMAEERRKKK